GCSTLITSAPSTASWQAANGPASTWVTSITLMPSNGRIAGSPSGGVAVEQFDRHSLGGAQEGDPHPRPHRGRLARELDALGFELGDDRVDAGHPQAEMVEAPIRRGRRRIDAIAGRHLRDEDVGAAELEVDARLALLHGADDLGAEHALIPPGGPLGVG